jgi:hypothetical protein
MRAVPEELLCLLQAEPLPILCHYLHNPSLLAYYRKALYRDCFIETGALIIRRMYAHHKHFLMLEWFGLPVM